MTTTTQLVILAGVGVGGYIVYKKLAKPAVSQTVGKSPTGAGTSSPANWWDQLSAAFGGKGGGTGGGSGDAQAAAGILGALGQLASGIGSAVKGIGEWQSSSGDTVGSSQSGGFLAGGETAGDYKADEIAIGDAGGGTSDWTPSLD